MPEELVLPVPEGLSMAEAASLPEAFATSYLNLVIEAGLKAGETVLIQAGASGLGIAAIQLAKAFGAKVVTTVGSEEKARVVRSLGAVSSSTAERTTSAKFLMKIRSMRCWTASAVPLSADISKSSLPAAAGF